MFAMFLLLAITVLRAPGAHAQQVPLLGERTFPEGVAAHRGTGDVFVGGAGDGTVQVIRSGASRYFLTSHSHGIRDVIGLAVDETRNRLWVTSNAFLEVLGGSVAPLSEILVFDTEGGRELGRFAVPGDGAPHFFNDVDVDSAGNAYITDGRSPIIWRVAADLSGLTPLVRSRTFEVTGFLNLNGVAVTPDQRFLVVSILGPGGGLFRVSRSGDDIQRITTPGGFGGGDGLVFAGPHELFTVLQGVHRVVLDEDYLSATVTSTSAESLGLDLPTTAAIVGTDLWVTNSQLDHLVPSFKNDAPPTVPFSVTRIPLATLRP